MVWKICVRICFEHFRFLPLAKCLSAGTQTIGTDVCCLQMSLNHTSLDLDACTQRPTNSRCPLFNVNTGTMPASLVVKPRVQVQTAHSRPRLIYGDISENRRRVTSNWPSSLYNMNKTGSVVQRNIEARSRNYCCSGTTISITYSVCVFVCVCSLRYPTCNAPNCLL
jgi:hypothetical protein